MNYKKIKLAVAGVGDMGLKHIDAIKKTKGAVLSAVVDLKENSFIKKINSNFYTSIRDMFKFEKIDGVIVATPNASHFSDSLEAVSYTHLTLPTKLTV